MLGEWGARIPSYTQICRRQKELNIPLGVKYSNDKLVDIAINSTGIKAFNRGEWIRQKWALRMGWVKLHITFDITNHIIISVQITYEHEADGKEFSKLVDGAKDIIGKISSVFGDSAYDSRTTFNYTASVGAEPVIKPKINSSGKSRVETVFSSLKRMIGEHFTSILNRGINNEILAKVYVYNIVEASRNGYRL